MHPEDLTILSKKWTVKRFLGNGGNGYIYELQHAKDNSKNAILKISSVPNDSMSMEREVKVLRRVSRSEGFPTTIENGELLSRFRLPGRLKCIILEKLGMNFDNLLERYEKIHIRDVLNVGIQLLKRIENLHNHGFIHRDIHPGNVMIGNPDVNDENTIYLIDFGCAKEYVTRRLLRKKHINIPTFGNIYGFPEFCSANVLKGNAASRRDDLVSFAYFLVYISQRSLPWTKVCDVDWQRNWRDIILSKETIEPSDLCYGLPSSISQIYSYACNLGFSERPDYKLLRKLLKNSLHSRNWSEKKKFEWTNCCR